MSGKKLTDMSGIHPDAKTLAACMGREDVLLWLKETLTPLVEALPDPLERHGLRLVEVNDGGWTCEVVTRDLVRRYVISEIEAAEGHSDAAEWDEILAEIDRFGGAVLLILFNDNVTAVTSYLGTEEAAKGPILHEMN